MPKRRNIKRTTDDSIELNKPVWPLSEIQEAFLSKDICLESLQKSILNLMPAPVTGLLELSSFPVMPEKRGEKEDNIRHT